MLFPILLAVVASALPSENDKHLLPLGARVSLSLCLVSEYTLVPSQIGVN